ncbi:SusD/RagB family nutrient-binding outer membrane lipoprotein [Spirosoma foliorum]|uniref:SusD/RagB family nutrient-binding outer membrane lipoprotein n=1 Tax=Spirosoma foliorum TaxID=2710596 RepID=A0A7G5GYK3_9BACT|nr:SusD/RagB family nutrient-binding outer membrane lipoprotein [Spirosoma foliorum]QMW03945.1 SusD/RagB family nutrient-binding outer membrane lipoprotein [Spirosoma foliorum]
MKTRIGKYSASCALVFALFFSSCKDITELNVNPNGVVPQNVNPDLILPTVLTEAAKSYLLLGFGDVSGIVQHTQGDAFNSGRDYYDWGQSNSWTASGSSSGDFYGIQRNNKLLYDRSVALGYDFHTAISLIMKSMIFGLVTDLWGDAPYSMANRGEEGTVETISPAYDSQESIYTAIMADLETANKLLAKSNLETVSSTIDVYYGGDATKWRQFGNTLLLRYYMRLSAKKPDVAKAGIEKIVAAPDTYPLITNPANDATMSYPGVTSGLDDWPTNTYFDASGQNYRRVKPCQTLVGALTTLKDPRLAVWAKKVEIPIVIDPTLPPTTDQVINNVRYFGTAAPALLQTQQIAPVNTDPNYVGLPAGIQSPSTYNANPIVGQASYNPHVSYLNDMYTQPSTSKSPLLKARLASAAEVQFILAEAAQKGWAAGDAKTHYYAGISASLTTWGVSSQYSTYIANTGVVYDGTVQQIITQKWIAGWTAATEAWFDWRRTGFPVLKAGTYAKRSVLPLRFYYSTDEQRYNTDNANKAISALTSTNYSQADGNNSAWSKMWLLQGVTTPW